MTHAEIAPDTVSHDASGPALQTHFLNNGDLLITLDDAWAVQNDWQANDTIRFEITPGKHITVINVDRNKRLQAN